MEMSQYKLFINDFFDKWLLNPSQLKKTIS